MSRILLADDSRFFRTIERQFLQKTPAELFEAGSSDELFAQLQAEKPHLLFLSCSLRPVDGVECCRRIKSDPQLRDIPVVMICDQNAPEQTAAARKSGCDDTLVKPLDRNRFLQIGRKYLSEVREHRQPCFMPVFFDWNGERCRGKSLDISAGGMFVESAHDIPVGTELALVFTLPGMAGETVCRGVVAWHNRRPNPLKEHFPVGFGVKFSNLPPRLAEQFNRMAAR